MSNPILDIYYDNSNEASDMYLKWLTKDCKANEIDVRVYNNIHDSCDVVKLYEFCDELEKMGFGKWDSLFDIPHKYVLSDWYVVHNTPHGYAIVTSRGFDTREILKDRPYVTLKRDGFLCIGWDRKM